MRTRHLALRRETLTALATDELANVAGAAAAHTIDLECVMEIVYDVIGESGTCQLVNPSLVIGCHSSPCTR